MRYRKRKTEGLADHWKELVRDPETGKLVEGRREPDTIKVPLNTLERLKAPTDAKGKLKKTHKIVRNPRAGHIIKDKR